MRLLEFKEYSIQLDVVKTILQFQYNDNVDNQVLFDKVSSIPNFSDIQRESKKRLESESDGFLYRGIKLFSDEFRLGGILKPIGPLESWTSDEETANSFAEKSFGSAVAFVIREPISRLEVFVSMDVLFEMMGDAHLKHLSKEDRNILDEYVSESEYLIKSRARELTKDNIKLR